MEKKNKLWNIGIIIFVVIGGGWAIKIFANSKILSANVDKISKKEEKEVKIKSFEHILTDSIIKYSFLGENNEKLKYYEFIEYLKSKDEDFFSVFQGALKDANSKLPAYFWECPSVSKETLTKPFEFMVTKSKELDDIRQDYSHLEGCLGKDNNVASFPSLSGDTLIVPIPKGGADYKNISQFTNNAPIEQQQAFWQGVANKLSEELEESKTLRWLSTHGLGVYYLHVRIDKTPKYYRFQKYKEEFSKQSEQEAEREESPNNSNISFEKQPTSPKISV